MRKIMLALMVIVLLPSMDAFSQRKDRSMFKEYESGFYQNFIMKDVRAMPKKEHSKKMEKEFQMDQSGLQLPNKVADYKAHDYWHMPTISQGNTYTCWCFSTTSFYESEEHRLFNKDIKLSVMYTVYWEYVEKAKGFVASRGTSKFDEGSEGNAVTRDYKKYGIVPRSVYDGLIDGSKTYSQTAMVNEMKSYLQSVKASNAWNEDEVVSTIKSIMNHYMGMPPTEFDYKGIHYTPKSFLKDFLKLKMDDYVEVLSYLQQPFWQKVEYQVSDNWWHSKDYYNVPLNDFMDILNHAIENGYTLSIGGDVSEAGLSHSTNVGLIPDFDIPSKYIDDNARQFRFSNGSTTDDHSLHLVGYLKDKNGKMWYLIKDTTSGSRNMNPDIPEFGYYFFSEDYVKLKIMEFTVNKDALRKYLSKFK